MLQKHKCLPHYPASGRQLVLRSRVYVWQGLQGRIEVYDHAAGGCCSGGGRYSAEVSELSSTDSLGSTRCCWGNLERQGLTGNPKNNRISPRMAALARLCRLRLILLLSSLRSLSLIGLTAAIALRARNDALLRCLVTLRLMGESTI